MTSALETFRPRAPEIVALDEEAASVRAGAGGVTFLPYLQGERTPHRDAAARGAGDGLHLALNIGAMLIAFIGLIAMLNGGLLALHNTSVFSWVPTSLQAILGHLFAPVAWLLGVPKNDLRAVGELIGKKVIINEYAAFSSLMKEPYIHMAPRSKLIATYACCVSLVTRYPAPSNSLLTGR